MSTSSRSAASIYIATVALVLLALTGIGLVASMALRPGVPELSATVSTGRIAVSCPTVREDTSCFLSKVTNSGGADGTFSCTVQSFGDTEATFVDGSSTVEITIAKDSSQDILTAVKSTSTGSVAPPLVQCAPLTS